MSVRAIADVQSCEENFCTRKKRRRSYTPEKASRLVRCHPRVAEQNYVRDVRLRRDSDRIPPFKRVCNLLRIVCQYNDQLEESARIVESTNNGNDELEQWLAVVMDVHLLSPEVLTVALVLLDRVQTAGASVTTTTVKTLLPTCIILASKFTMDERVFNADFLFMFEDLCADAVGQLESEVLHLLDWAIFVSRDMYHEYNQAIFST